MSECSPVIEIFYSWWQIAMLNLDLKKNQPLKLYRISIPENRIEFLISLYDPNKREFEILPNKSSTFGILLDFRS